MLVAGLLGIAALAQADWVALTGAENSPDVMEVHVGADAVRVKLEIHPDDLAAFADLLPAGAVSAAARPREPGTGLQVLADGQALQATLIHHDLRERIDRGSPLAMTGLPYTAPPEETRVHYLELAYPLPARPSTLTLVPPRKPSGYAAVNIGFIVFHDAVPIIDFRYLAGAETLRLDHADPWFSRFDNPNLNRHHREPVMSFLYVEDLEVRHEIIARVRDLIAWMDLDIPAGSVLTGAEAAQLREAIGAFVATRNPVHIDGREAQPMLDRVNFVQADARGIQVLPDDTPVDVDRALAGIILAFITPAIPGRVRVHWDLFNDRIDRVPVVQTDPAGRFQLWLDRAQPVVTWENLLKRYRPATIAPPPVVPARITLPLVSAMLVLAALACLLRGRRSAPAPALLAGLALLALAVAARPLAPLQLPRPLAQPALAEEQAAATIKALLANIYRALDFRRDTDAYDKLALSVSGDLLASLYLDHRAGWLIENQGGARARVRDVDLLSLTPLTGTGDEAGQLFRCRWSAAGSVGHWGHVHERTNAYEARLRISPVDGHWKITALQFLRAERLDTGAVSVSAMVPAP